MLSEFENRRRLAASLAENDEQEERISSAMSLLSDLPPETVAAIFRWRASQGGMTDYRIVKVRPTES